MRIAPRFSDVRDDRRETIKGSIGSIASALCEHHECYEILQAADGLDAVGPVCLEAFLDRVSRKEE